MLHSCSKEIPDLVRHLRALQQKNKNLDKIINGSYYEIKNIGCGQEGHDV